MINRIATSDDIIKTLQWFYDMNDGDEATQNILLCFCSELLGISEDEILTMLRL